MFSTLSGNNEKNIVDVKAEIKDKTKGKIKVKIITGISASVALFVGYLLGGRLFFFLHGMDQWPIVLLVLGLIVIAISALANTRKVMIATVVGYVVGFAFGMLFNWDTFDPNSRTYRNNNWQIWTLVFLTFIVIGIVWEIAYRYMKKTGR